MNGKQPSQNRNLVKHFSALQSGHWRMETLKHVTFENHTLQVSENKLDFCYVRKEADALVAEYLKAPMQIAWCDGVNQTKHPEVPEGQHKQS